VGGAAGPKVPCRNPRRTRRGVTELTSSVSQRFLALFFLFLTNRPCSYSLVSVSVTCVAGWDLGAAGAARQLRAEPAGSVLSNTQHWCTVPKNTDFCCKGREVAKRGCILSPCWQFGQAVDENPFWGSPGFIAAINAAVVLPAAGVPGARGGKAGGRWTGAGAALAASARVRGTQTIGERLLSVRG